MYYCTSVDCCVVLSDKFLEYENKIVLHKMFFMRVFCKCIISMCCGTVRNGGA
jgi:hypothetical protein